ncbi:glycosyltransferase family 2 protein [Alkalihalobacterium bogoriense]|uniref:glycosyltransferase family 2 protein n=1 Tax=Alkalihalobacterium bogoriense TaxID=246272 RepID=UPI000550A28C|nr:glycosyltransferase [Alkalihalobacterium bogoriense]
MKKKPKISIIIPLYNVKQYVGRCLDSLINQTMSEIEFIVVNDGSTDGSEKIVMDYAKNDERIVLINKENAGVSSARNEGLNYVKGDFIGFVDPDDWVNYHMYETMYEIATKEKMDVVMCTYIREFGTHSKEKTFLTEEKQYYYNEDVQSQIMRRIIGPLNAEIRELELLDAYGTVWSKLYRTSLIKENTITFTDLSIIGTNEDSLFNMEVLYYTNAFVLLNKPLYHYWRQNEQSVTSKYKPDLMKKWGHLYEHIEMFIQEKQLGDDYVKALNNRISLNTLGLGLNEISASGETSVLQKYRNMKNILQYKTIKHAVSTLDMKHFPFIWKVFYFFVKLKFTLGYYFMIQSIEHLRKIVR